MTLPRPHPAQLKIIRESTNVRYKVVCNGRRWGKSILGIDRLTPVIMAGYPVGWFSGSDKVLDDAWRETIRMLYNAITYKNEVDRRIEFVTGGSLEMWSLKAPLVARSRKYKEVVIDEAALCKTLRERWDYEIRPTLLDYAGGAWFLSTPQGFDDFKALFDLGDPRQPLDAEWRSWQMPTWSNPHLPKEEMERIKRLCDIGDRAALQEYGADFIASEDVFVPPEWLDACSIYGGMPPMRPNQPIIVGLDAASVSDTFAIVGIYRDWSNGGRYSTAFVRVFEPQELREGSIISFSKPRAFVAALKQSYHVVAYVYDPFQMVDFAGQGMLDGLGFFHQMNQGQDRLFADRHFYEIIRDGRFAFDGQAHQVLGQHIKNANSKLTDDKLRMIKRKDELKIDAGVAASMACYAAAEWYNI